MPCKPSRSSTRDVRVTASGPHNPSSPPWNIMSVSVRGLHSAAPGSLFRSADSVARQPRLTCLRFRLISGLERTGVVDGRHSVPPVAEAGTWRRGRALRLPASFIASVIPSLKSTRKSAGRSVTTPSANGVPSSTPSTVPPVSSRRTPELALTSMGGLCCNTSPRHRGTAHRRRPARSSSAARQGARREALPFPMTRSSSRDSSTSRSTGWLGSGVDGGSTPTLRSTAAAASARRRAAAPASGGGP